MTERASDKTGQPDELQLLRERVDYVADWIWEIDLEGIIVYSNRALSHILGYDPQSVIGRSILEFVSHGEESKCRRMLQSAASRSQPVPKTTVHFQAHDGGIRALELRCDPMSGEGRTLIGYRGIARDITEQVARLEEALEAEANYKIVAEKSPVGLLVVRDDVLVYVNPKICELMGYRCDEVTGTPIWNYVHPQDAVQFAGYEAAMLAGEDVPTHSRARGITKGREVRYFDFHTCVIQQEGRPALLINAVDVTDSVRAEEALAKSERDYRQLVEEISDWVWQVDEGVVYTYVSPRCRDLLGFEPEEILGRTAFDFMPPDEAERVRPLFEAAVEKREPIALLENTLLHRDGHLVVVETSGSPIFDDAWIFRGYRGIDRDITQRRLALEQLESERGFISTVLETAAALVLVLDSKGRIVKFNRECERVLGYSLDEVQGKPFWDVVEPAERADDAREVFSHPRPAAVPKEFEGHWITKEGASRLLAWHNSVMLDDDGQVEFVILTGIDVTERRRSEEALRESREMLRLVMDSIPQFIFWKDRNGVFMGCNENFARVAGFSSAAEVVGKTDYDMAWGKTEAESYIQWDRRVMETDQPQYHISEPQLIADGETIWLDTNKVPLHDSEGRVVGILGTYENVTEHKRAEQDLLEAEAKYRSLVEETMIGVYLIQDDQFAYVNPRMLEIFGASESDMLGRSPLEFAAPEDRALVADNIRKRMRGELRTIRYAFRASRIDGTPLDVEVHGANTSYKGRPAIIGSLVDITERKRYLQALQDSEERYRQLFEHSPDMVLLISPDTWQFTAMNPAVTKVLGYAPFEVLGRAPWDLSPEFQPDGQRSIDRARELLAKGRNAPTQRFDWVFKGMDGSLVDCEVSLVGYRFHGDDVIQAIVRDVTERKRADENRHRFEREMEIQKRSFYRETILSVTDGTLDICEAEDVEPYIERSTFAVDVDDASQVSPARRQAEEYLVGQGLKGDRLDQFMVGVGEAITNAIKHGVHGIVHAGSDEATVWVAISDAGPGIESLILPKAVLLRGFSTKPSLGLGYSIMLDVSDRILLTTSDKGTTVVLIKEKTVREVSFGSEFLPDTWSNIPG